MVNYSHISKRCRYENCTNLYDLVALFLKNEKLALY